MNGGYTSALRPTRRCFEDVLDFFVERQVPSCLFHRFTIVHGILLTPAEGQRFAHAWIEYVYEGREFVVQAGLSFGIRVYFAVTREMFERDMRPQHATRYTVVQAAAENERTNMLGPWVPEYLELCSDES